MSPRLSSLLTKIQPAGVILFARNITGANQTHTLLRECQKCVATAFHLRGPEGGTVDRFRKRDWCGAFSGRGFCHGQPGALSQAWTSDRRELPRDWLQRGFCAVLDLAYEASER